MENKTLQMIIEQSEVDQGVVRIQKDSSNSKTHHFYLRFTSFFYKGKKMYSLLLSNITEIKHKEEEKALNKFKTIMFASMTHEIRTPLNGIINS
jgi:signal transduction histidine kinase